MVELVFFFVTAAIAVVGALAMLVTRNAVHSALFLLLNFGAIAVLFLMLLAPFLFVVQLTIYAGAIMVLFLFVMMLLGAERVEDSPDRIGWQRPFALLLALILFAQALFVGLRTANTPPAVVTRADDFGSPVEIGRVLFTQYLLPFEITGVILLIAVVGVVVLNQRGRQTVPLDMKSGD